MMKEEEGRGEKEEDDKLGGRMRRDGGRRERERERKGEREQVKKRRKGDHLHMYPGGCRCFMVL